MCKDGFACMPVCSPHTSLLDFLELGLQMAVSHPYQVLGIERARVTGGLKGLSDTCTQRRVETHTGTEVKRHINNCEKMGNLHFRETQGYEN